jgi:ketosteroid isomerase-like protein
MPEENLQLVREGFVAMERGDADALVAISHPEVEWINPDYAVESGTRMGREGFRKAVGATHDSFDEMKFEIEEMFEVGDRVVVAIGMMSAKGKGSGLEIEQPFGNVFTIEDGKLIRFQWFRDPAEARAAAVTADEVANTQRSQMR